MEWCRNEKNRGEKFCVSNHGIEQHNCERSRKKLKRADNHLAYLFSNRDVKKVLIVNLKRMLRFKPNNIKLRSMEVLEKDVHGAEMRKIEAKRIKLIVTSSTY